MSDLPPPPDSQDSVTPEKPRKKRDWWNIGVATVLSLVAAGILGTILYAANTEPAKDYTPNGSVATPESVAQPSDADVEAMTFAVFQALEADNEQLFQATLKDIQEKTGCLAVAGGRVIVDPADQAEVAKEASQRAQFEDSLEEQGLVVGHIETDTPEGHLHQVIGFECK